MIYTLSLNPALDVELTVPALAFDTVLRSESGRVDPGGKGFNVARTLKALGADGIALGLVGGRAGDLLAAGLEAEGIAGYLIRVAGETRTNFSVVDRAHAHTFKVNQPGPTVRPEEQTALLDEVRRLAAPGDWWVLSGSLPPGIPAAFYAEIVRLIQAAGGKAVLDSSGEALRLGCAAGPALIKPNLEEARELLRRDDLSAASLPGALPALHALGARQVLVSLGEAGAVLSIGRRAWLAESPRVQVRNPIGAGDALIAGTVWAFSQGEPPDAALAWGVACGAAAAGLDGTAAGDFETVRALRGQVNPRPLSPG